MQSSSVRTDVGFCASQSWVQGSIYRHNTVAQNLQCSSGFQRNHIAPLRDGGGADIEDAANGRLGSEMPDCVVFEHAVDANPSFHLLQPQLAPVSLTLVIDMKTLRDRLVWAMKRTTPPITNADLVRAIKADKAKISSAAVAKWFTSVRPPEFIQPAYLFAVARRCGVDAEWLATARGEPLKSTVDHGLPYRRLTLIKAYGTLPPEVRMPIRALIETLATAQSDRYSQWSDAEGERAKHRDMVHDKEKS
jgi:hypothetical protein